MDNRDYMAVVILIAGSIYSAILYFKREKVLSEKEEVQQKMQERQEQLLYEQPTGYLDQLCEIDCEYTFLEKIYEQVCVYLEQLDFALLFTLVPVFYALFGPYQQVYLPNDNGINNRYGKERILYRREVQIKQSKSSNLIPRVGSQPLHDINGNLYLFKHFEGNTYLYTILQKKMIQRCVSNKPVDKWNFINNLDRLFQVHHIKGDQRVRVIMVALNICKYEESNIGFLDNTNYSFSSNELMIANHIAKYCLLPQVRYSHFLSKFFAYYHLLGGNTQNNKQFLENLDKQKKAKIFRGYAL